MLSVPSVFMSVPGFPVRMARCGSAVLRIVLVGAAAVLAYGLLSALNGDSAQADDGGVRERATTNRTDADGVVDGLLATVLDRLAAMPPVARLTSTAVDPPSAVAGSPSRSGSRRATPDRPRPPEVSATVGTGVVPRTEASRTEASRTVRDAVTTIIDQGRSQRRPPRPAGPRDPAAPPADATPGVVSGVVALVPAVVQTVPDVVDTVPAVVGTVPDVVETVPTVVGAVPDLLGTIPRVVDLLPEVVPGVAEVLPEVIGGRPVENAPGSPADPLAPTDPLRPIGPSGPSDVSPPARTGITTESAMMDISPGVLTFPAATRADTRSWHRPSSGMAGSVRADIGHHSPPAHPPTNKPLLGAQQAGGATGGFAHPHAMPAATTAVVAYQLLYTQVARQIDPAGLVPGVPALPG